MLVFEFKCYNGMGVYVVGEGVVPDEPSQTVVTGDVNGDGVVTAADVTAIYDFLLNNDTTNLINGDVNGDGNITSGDVTEIYNILLGISK